MPPEATPPETTSPEAMPPEANGGDGSAEPATTRDRLLDGRIVLHQQAGGHRAGTDAVLLAAATRIAPGELVVDAGAASGAVGLMVAARERAARAVLVERDPALAALGARNIAENGLRGRAFSVCADHLVGPAIAPGSADAVATNPPFFEALEAPASPDPRRARAHVLEGGTLAAWIAACAVLLRRRGRLVLIQRADKLGACLSALAPSFGAVRLIAVHPRADRPAGRVLIEAAKGARTPLAILPPLVLHDADGGFTPTAERAHREGVLEGGFG